MLKPMLRPPPLPRERSSSSCGPVVTVPDAPEERRGDRPVWSEKVALGIGSLPLFYGYAGVKSLAVPVYQMVLGLNPALLGAVLAIPRLWDGLTDPVVGVFSDNWHSRFGRRRPLILVGAALQAGAFGLIWMVPGGWGEWATAGYLLGALLLFYTCFSIFSVPLMSLGYEMTADHHERTRIAAYSGFFSKVAELTYSWVFWAANLAVFGSVLHGMRLIGWGVALVIMGVAGAIPALRVKERYQWQASRQARVRIAPSIRAALANRAFVILAGICLLQILAGMLASNLDYYLLVYHVCGGSIIAGTKWKGILSTGYAVVGVASIAPVTWLSARIGKARTLTAAFVLVGLDGIVKWFVFTPGNPWKILLDPLLCAPVWPALQILMPSMLADICDDDELRHGLRREGVLGAFYSWIQKTGCALGFFGSGLALALTGFDVHLGGAQPGRAIFSMRFILSLSTVLWAGATLVLLALYPLGTQRARQIRAALEARRGRITEPLSVAT